MSRIEVIHLHIDTNYIEYTDHNNNADHDNNNDSNINNKNK